MSAADALQLVRSIKEQKAQLRESQAAAASAVQDAIDRARGEIRSEMDQIIAQARGPRGPIGPMPEHEWNGSRLRFEIAPNQWGEWTDLQGPPGARGPRGPKGEPGTGEGGGTDLNSLPQALDQPPEEVVIRQGGDWYRIPWDDFIEHLPTAPTGTVYAGDVPVRAGYDYVRASDEE